MRTSFHLMASLLLSAACTKAPEGQPAADANAGIDSLNSRLVEAYRTRDPVAYGKVFTDTAVFEWPAFNTVRGRAGLEAMARANWPDLPDMNLALTVSARRIGADHATEFGAFQQSWNDAKRGRMVEYGRYVALLVRHDSTGWRIDRWAGFEDSSRNVGR